MHLADVGHDVWIGDFQACNKHLHTFDHSIHIWRQSNVHEKRICNCMLEKKDLGIVVKYRENDPIHTTSVPLKEIARYAGQDGRILIHCAGGVCRSATLCLVAKIARGCNRYDAISDIYEGMYTTYQATPELYNHVVKDIFRFFEIYIEEICLL